MRHLFGIWRIISFQSAAAVWLQGTGKRLALNLDQQHASETPLHVRGSARRYANILYEGADGARWRQSWSPALPLPEELVPLVKSVPKSAQGFPESSVVAWWAKMVFGQSRSPGRALLQDLQEYGLRRCVQFSDLIQEDRSATGPVHGRSLAALV